jgi:transcriptional regulator with XRE-family HTH domain
MSQEKLGEALGLTFQQVQKYERGANRIGCSRLYDLSQVLDVPVSYFFDDMPEEAKAASPANITGGYAPSSDSEVKEFDIMSSRMTLEVVRAYYAIPGEDHRKRVLDLMRAMGNAVQSD